MESITHILDIHKSAPTFSFRLLPPILFAKFVMEKSEYRRRELDVRDADAPLPRPAAVELDPRVVGRVVSHGERVDGRPEAPAGPLSHVRVRRACHDEGYQVAEVRGYDGQPAAVGLVADVGEEEDDEKREAGADCGEGVGLDAVEA